MTDQQDKKASDNNRRGNDRRVTRDTNYTGPERRKGERRLHERHSD
jgi:hypothetical protein